MGEVHRSQIRKQEELPDGDLLPLRRPGHGALMPLKTRKSLDKTCTVSNGPDRELREALIAC
jgi:hypothetical protein